MDRTPRKIAGRRLAPRSPLHSSRLAPAMILAAVLAGVHGFGAGIPYAASFEESCEYRVVQWNAAGSDPAWNQNMDIPVAETLFFYAGIHQANVMTLQEVTDGTLQHLATLLPGWNCYPGAFGVDYIAVCVDGAATNFNSRRLGDVTPNPSPPLFWGYVQVEYEGVLLTSVHTRNFWDVEHVAELHRDVTTGIIGGDFNYETPEMNPLDPNDPLWYQTDPNLQPTWRDPDLDMEVKIDHILAIDEPLHVSGSAEGKEGSNHRVVLGAVKLLPRDPELLVSLSGQQPVEVDGSCEGTIQFQVDIHDDCCLDPNALDLVVTAANPTANATLGPVSIDAVQTIDARRIAVAGHLTVSALQSCPAEVVIEASARDCAGNEGDSASQGTGASAVVIDATPPEITPAQADLYCLWPPNHQYVCFDSGQFNPGVTDNCTASPAWAFASCASDQPDNGRGDGNTSEDCVIDADALGFCARSERTGLDPGGRRYAPSVAATDLCGNVSAPSEIGSIYVPHDQSPSLTCLAPPAPAMGPHGRAWGERGSRLETSRPRRRPPRQP